MPLTVIAYGMIDEVLTKKSPPPPLPSPRPIRIHLGVTWVLSRNYP